MIKIYLARHGQDEDNASGILNGRRDKPLTDIGSRQALTLAQNIKDHNLKIGKVFSSPLLRAYKTAEAITDTLNLDKPKKLELLIERDFGIMTGEMIKNIQSMCSLDIIKTDTITYFLSPNEAETFSQLIDRANELFNWIEQQNFSENILLVTHGDIGKMIYAAYYNLPWKNVLTDFHFGNTELLLLDKDAKQKNRLVIKTKQHNH
ncbi:MAG: histidine phosphatase family protein [Patescibacteria group bacterium]|jgi:broad specificity phosphatase PhoE|nr:histidine phosphatase family protein [Patescibacteria group bacterium]